MTPCRRCVCTVSVTAIAYAGFRIEEVVFLINVEDMIDVHSVISLIELVIDTISLVRNMTILSIGKDAQLRCYSVCSLHIYAVIAFVGSRIVVLIIAFSKIFIAQLVIGNISNISEVIASELLQRHASYDIPLICLVVGIPNESVCVLLQTFLADKVCTLNGVSL